MWKMSDHPAMHSMGGRSDGELPVTRETETFGTELRRLRQAQRLSLSDLARQVHYSRGFLSKIENGRAQPNEALAAACDDLLGAQGQLIRLRRPPRRRSPAGLRAVRPIDLPAATSVFVGRTPELAAIADHLADHMADEPRPSRIVVVSGLPGVGKTELIIQAANRLQERYRDGCLFLALHHGENSVDVPTAMNHLLRRVGVAPELMPALPQELAALYRQIMRNRRMLLLLDTPAQAADISALVIPGGAGDMLVASRRRLDALDEALHIDLAPLGERAARNLFDGLARGPGAKPEASPDTHVNRILDACAGLPLAVRIAAARVRAARPADPSRLVADLQDDQLAALDDGERSVGRTFAEACAVLPPEIRRMFALLALHDGPSFDDGAAAALADISPTGAGRQLDQLVGACLVRRVGPTRHALHDLARAAAARLAGSTFGPEEAQAAGSRLLGRYLVLAQQADCTLTPSRHREPQVRPPADSDSPPFDGPETAFAWLDAERGNLVAACESALDSRNLQACWQLAYATRDYFFRTRFNTDWIRVSEAGLSAARAGDDRWAIAVTLNNLGLAYTTVGFHGRAETCYVETRQRFRDLADRYGEANALGHLAWVAHVTARNDLAVEHASAALSVYEELGVSRNAAITRRTLAVIATAEGDTSAAEAHLQSALEVFVRERLVLDESMTLNCLGDVELRRRRSQNAMAFYRRAAGCARACHSVVEEARALDGLAAAADGLGEKQASRRLLERAREVRGLG
jgi:tetratricopeptide (TPR) repeat protein/DNA-binding XRE family transcriptional regulator